MSSPPSTATPVFQLFSIGFGGSGTPPLPMRDLLTNLEIGGPSSPEWVLNHRSAPVAYSQGASATLQVVFQACNVDQFPMGENYTIQATGDLLDVTPQSVAISIQPLDGFSSPVQFSLSGPIPAGISVRTLTLSWTATDPQGQTAAIGTSSHTLYVTWQFISLGADLLPPPVPFQPVAQMAVEWAAGQTTLEDICAALVQGIATLNISRSVAGTDARMALLLRKADSVGFTDLLSQLLLTHGILAVARAIAVDWDHPPTHSLDWVPTATTAPAPVVTGPQIYYLCLIASGTGVILCDGETSLGPISLPMPLPPDHAWTLTGSTFDLMQSRYLEPATKRLAGLPAAMQPAGPVEVFSVHFAFPGSEAIPLRDPVTDGPIGVTPEWVIGIDQIPPVPGQQPPAALPAAFVRGTTVSMEVTFLRTVDQQHGGADTMTLVIGATGTPAGVVEQTVTLTFMPNGRSAKVRFTMDQPASADVATTLLNLHWYVKTETIAPTPIGKTTHPVFFTWKPVTVNAAEGLPDFAYSPIVRWTCDFAAGAASDKEVCDRVFANLSKTGLKYGVAGWTPRQMLLGGGGMCGGWYQLFQLMLACQGVLVAKRAFLVDWRTLAADAVEWNAIVVSSGGLNQPTPPVTPSVFHDLSVFPIPTTATLVTTAAPRYRFWGIAGSWSDGHCINFLVSDGELFLYDASFSLGPIALSMPLPPADGTVLGGADLVDFVAKYLDIAVSHMLGSFTVNGQELTSVIPEGAAAGVNGVSVVTSALPTMVGAVPTITFKWI